MTTVSTVTARHKPHRVRQPCCWQVLRISTLMNAKLSAYVKDVRAGLFEATGSGRRMPMAK